MANRIVFTGKQQVSLETFTPAKVDVGQVRVQVLKSLMSTGTENIVFNRLFDAGTHWDNWVKYPFYPGYSCVGVVEEVGPEVKALAVGQRVAVRKGHASHHVVGAGSCYPVPEEVSTDDAVWFALAKIAFMGAQAAQYAMGDSALIVGAGPIGQMSVRWALAAGAAPVIIADTVERRLELARLAGPVCTVAQPVDSAEKQVRACNGNALPRVVIDTTGNAQVFAGALTLAADFGRVVVLGDTGTPAQQRLTMDVIRRGLSIVGAHDIHSREPWTEPKIVELFFELVRSDRFRVSGLNTHSFSPQECVSAYETANTRRGETMGIVFDWAV